MFVVTQEQLTPGTDCMAILDGCGFSPLMSLTGMVAHQVTVVGRVPSELELVIPDDDTGCAAILDVNSAAYGANLDPGKPVWGCHQFWRDHSAVLGMASGQPVSSAAVMVVEGHHYVALVATTPNRQRNGFAAAAMYHALEVSRRKHGDWPTFLHATEAGRPVYQRMGYRAVSSHALFVDKKILESH
jgi:hypothetical protein